MIIDKLNFVKKKVFPPIVDDINTILSKKKKGYACIVNGSVLARCFSEESYKDLVLASDFNFCDGIIPTKVYNLTQKDKVQKISGPEFFNYAVRQPELKQFFLGSTDEILDGLYTNLKKNNPTLQRSDFYSPPFLPIEKFNFSEIAKIVNDKKPDIIWLSFGNPKQEIFASKLLPYLDRGFMLTVGAAFAFYSGVERFKDAPQWMHKSNMVWLYRALQEPKRIIPRHLNTFSKLPKIIFTELFSR